MVSGDATGIRLRGRVLATLTCPHPPAGKAGIEAGLPYSRENKRAGGIAWARGVGSTGLDMHCARHVCRALLASSPNPWVPAFAGMTDEAFRVGVEEGSGLRANCGSTQAHIFPLSCNA